MSTEVQSVVKVESAKKSVHLATSFSNKKQKQDEGKIKFRKRSQSFSGGKLFPPYKKRKKEKLILPTKFLLGGNIRDPLNLNSFQDEEVNRAMNAVTPESSPVPTPQHRKGEIEVIIPANIRDPLSLAAGVEDDDAYAASFITTTAKRVKKYKKKKKSKSSTGSGKEDNTDIKSDESKGEETIEAELNKGSADKNHAADEIFEEMILPNPPKEVVPNEEISNLREGIDNGAAESSVSRAAPARPSSLGGDQFVISNSQICSTLPDQETMINPIGSSVVSTSTSLTVNTTNTIIDTTSSNSGTAMAVITGADNIAASSTNIVVTSNTVPVYCTANSTNNGVAPPQPAVVPPSCATGNKTQRKFDNKDKIVSPVVPQPGAWLDRHHHARFRKQSIASGSASFTGTTNRQVPKFKEANKKFQYGNYHRYYGYRNENEEDGRLKLLFQRLGATFFQGKDVLDIGCNSGLLTVAVAKDFGAKHVIGMDIDKSLIHLANTSLKRYSQSMATGSGTFKSGQVFPLSMPVVYGSLNVPGVRDTPFPRNISFLQGNYVLESDILLDLEQPQFDIILCLSVTKWIHLNWGDDGLKRAFKRMYAQLRPGGVLILEPQSWTSYKKKKNLTETTWKNYDNIKLMPSNFTEYLLTEVGFNKCEVIGSPYNPSKGFQRPIKQFTKGRVGCDTPTGGIGANISSSDSVGKSVVKSVTHEGLCLSEQVPLKVATSHKDQQDVPQISVADSDKSSCQVLVPIVGTIPVTPYANSDHTSFEELSDKSNIIR